MSPKKVFIIGPGYIGWNVLELLVQENYQVTGFVRREAHAAQLKASGASDTVIGDLGDQALITKHAAEHDVIIHTATADDLPSVEAVLTAVRQRADKGLSTIYIHTSGTSVLCSDPSDDGSAKHPTVYHDNVRAEVDAVPDSAPHREIDLTIIGAQKQLADKAKMAIMIPPLIYGANPRRPGRLSIQIPTLTRYALKHGFAGHTGNGAAVWSRVHVLDLARAYVVLLHHLESATPAPDDNPYYFCESSGEAEQSWAEIAEVIGAELHARGLIADAAPRTIPRDTWGDLFGPASPAVVGLNSRSRAVRLRALGWAPVEKSWQDSFAQDELPAILKEGGGDWKAFSGYGGPVTNS
ncbi:hypothetical protein F4778DRAFT_787085 [Xylariomycetidae sp. FL2044]|nr:hypothetical protein F4778DRAFT_787085 [Xylariomycetidae sp. FL2044]